MEDIIVGSGKVTKIEYAKPTEEKKITDPYFGGTKIKTVAIKGASACIVSTVTLDKKLDVKNNTEFNFKGILEFGKEYELILKEKKPSPLSGRMIRDKEE